jgi:hypothetical protein
MGQLFLVMSAEMYSTLTVVGDMAKIIFTELFGHVAFKYFPVANHAPA